MAKNESTIIRDEGLSVDGPQMKRNEARDKLNAPPTEENSGMRPDLLAKTLEKWKAFQKKKRQSSKPHNDSK